MPPSHIFRGAAPGRWGYDGGISHEAPAGERGERDGLWGDFLIDDRTILVAAFRGWKKRKKKAKTASRMRWFSLSLSAEEEGGKKGGKGKKGKCIGYLGVTQK